jgi:hypothetical protein
MFQRGRAERRATLAAYKGGNAPQPGPGSRGPRLGVRGPQRFDTSARTEGVFTVVKIVRSTGTRVSPKTYLPSTGANN